MVASCKCGRGSEGARGEEGARVRPLCRGSLVDRRRHRGWPPRRHRAHGRLSRGHGHGSAFPLVLGSGRPTWAGPLCTVALRPGGIVKAGLSFYLYFLLFLFFSILANCLGTK